MSDVAMVVGPHPAVLAQIAQRSIHEYQALHHASGGASGQTVPASAA